MIPVIPVMSRDHLHEDQIVLCLKLFYFDVVVNCSVVATLSSSLLCSVTDITCFVMPLPPAIGSKRHYVIWSSIQLSVRVLTPVPHDICLYLAEEF